MSLAETLANLTAEGFLFPTQASASFPMYATAVLGEGCGAEKYTARVEADGQYDVHCHAEPYPRDWELPEEPRTSSVYINLVLAVCALDRGDTTAFASNLSCWLHGIFTDCYTPDRTPRCEGYPASCTPRIEERWVLSGGYPRSIRLAIRTTCAPRTWTHPQPQCFVCDEWEP